MRLIDFCITQLKAQGPSRTCNESKEEENCGLPMGEPWHGRDAMLGVKCTVRVDTYARGEMLRYRGTSLIINSAPLRPYSRKMPRVLW